MLDRSSKDCNLESTSSARKRVACRNERYEMEKRATPVVFRHIIAENCIQNIKSDWFQMIPRSRENLVDRNTETSTATFNGDRDLGILG